MMLESINPATGRVIASHPAMDEAEVRRILDAAGAASRDWAAEPIAARAARMGDVPGVLDARKEELARLITREMGKPIGESRAEIEKCAWVCRHYAERAPAFLADEPLESDARSSLLVFQPLGVVLAVMPWNFPFWQVFRFAAPGLTAGNGAVLKHASNVCGCALAIEAVFREAGFPEDLFRTLLIGSGQVEGVLRHDAVRAATLTGGEGAGTAIASAAGAMVKKTVLELGGSDPYLILDDANLDEAARLCAQSRLINGGQSCIAAKRFLVDRRVADAFVEKLEAEMAARRPGDPEDEDVDLGPMARADLRDDVHGQVSRSVEAGAVVRLGGAMPKGRGFHYPPTILTEVRPGMPAFDEEVFGPVAAVTAVDDADEAVRLANRSRFGLGSAVFTRDLGKGEAIARRIESGCCFVNDFVKSDPRLPFGGIKRSGYGRELAEAGIREFVNLKTICINGA